MSEHPPAGWFPDPDDASQQRYWDGSAWTEHRVPAAGPGGPPAQAGHASYAGPGVAGPVTSGATIAAFVMGLLSVIACLGPITGIPAIVVGRRARREIDSSQGSLEGRGLATTGIVVGVVGTILWGLVALFLVGAWIILLSSGETTF